jgi:hypothetical protein
MQHTKLKTATFAYHVLVLVRENSSTSIKLAFNFPPFRSAFRLFLFQDERIFVKRANNLSGNFSESKAINKFFFRLFFDLISAFNFQQTLSNRLKIEKKKSRKIVSQFALRFSILSSR